MHDAKALIIALIRSCLSIMDLLPWIKFQNPSCWINNLQQTVRQLKSQTRGITSARAYEVADFPNMWIPYNFQQDENHIEVLRSPQSAVYPNLPVPIPNLWCQMIKMRHHKLNVAIGYPERPTKNSDSYQALQLLSSWLSKAPAATPKSPVNTIALDPLHPATGSPQTFPLKRCAKCAYYNTWHAIVIIYVLRAKLRLRKSKTLVLAPRCKICSLIRITRSSHCTRRYLRRAA